ncbi:MAG: suppressor of fused domain protein [Blastocatellia bacterium]
MSERDAPVSPENRMIARYVATVFGGTPRVADYADRSEQLTVGILDCRDRPREGVTSYSTIRLSDHPMQWGEREFPVRLELAGVCANTAEYFPNVLASAAFCIMRSEAVYHPGTVMPDYVRLSFAAATLPHLYLTAPFLWENELTMLDCGTKKVSWLLAMPISEPEYSYLKQYGDEALERLLEAQHADVTNPERPSVV